MLQQLLGNTVGEEGLSHTRVAVEEKIAEFLPECINKFMAALQSDLHGLSGRAPGEAVYMAAGIVFHGKCVEILPVQHFLQVGLGIEKIDDSLLKAVAFSVPDIPGILTVGTRVVKIQIIRRITVFPQKCKLFFGKCMNFLF